MVRWESCGVDLPEGARFCSSCGAHMGGVGKEESAVSSEDLVGRIKELLHEGDMTRVVVKDEEGRTLLETPSWAGVVGAILAPWLAALGAIAALATRCTVTVVRRE